MTRYEKTHRFLFKATTVATNMVHSVIMMGIFWLLLDLMQSHILTKPPAATVANLGNNKALTAPIVNAHNYGYFSNQASQKSLIVAFKDQQAATEKPMVLAKVRQATMKAKVLMAKATPRIDKVTKSPKVMVKHVDARGPRPSWARVDL
jgi:hypothetical protein